MADEKPEGKVVFQVLNLDREEMFFGITDKLLVDQIAEIAQEKAGPAKDWKQGELVQWRPLTDFLPEDQAIAMAVELEGRTPPNKFRVIPYASTLRGR